MVVVTFSTTTTTTNNDNIMGLVKENNERKEKSAPNDINFPCLPFLIEQYHRPWCNILCLGLLCKCISVLGALGKFISG